MAHIHEYEDSNGDLIDVEYFCSDACNQLWCQEKELTYSGWNGCHEIHDSPQWCANCHEALGYWRMELDPFRMAWISPATQEEEKEGCHYH